MRFFFLLALTYLVLSAAGCGEDSPTQPVEVGCTIAVFNERLDPIASRIGNTLSAFAADPSTANCNAYRAALRDYLDLAEEFEDCPEVGNSEDYRADVRDARQELDDIDC